MIQAQLDAFRDHDGEKAFGYATPELQIHFGNHHAFMSVVKAQYQPVYRNREARFQQLHELPGGIPTRDVYLVGANGQEVIATYAMERQADGEWRSGDCLLHPVMGRPL